MTQNDKVQWIISYCYIFFSVKRQQLCPWSIQWQLHWMSSLKQPCLIVIKRQDSSISTKDKGQRICRSWPWSRSKSVIGKLGPIVIRHPELVSIWRLRAKMVVTNKSSRPLSGDFGKPAALDPWKYIHDILIHSIIFGQTNKKWQ